jgi:hypothetical protein
MYDVMYNPKGWPTDVTNMLPPGQSWTPIFPELVAGPVEVTAWRENFPTEARNVIASQRLLNHGAGNEMSGIGVSHMDNGYIWTWYDNNRPGAADWVCIGNPNPQAAYIRAIVGHDLAYDSYNSGKPIPAYTTMVLRLPPGSPLGLSKLVIVISNLSCVNQECSTPGPNFFASQRVLWGPLI